MKTKKQCLPLSREDGFSMISDYFSSGMRSGEYYPSHGVSEWQFYKWKKLYLQEHPELNPRAGKPSFSSAAVPAFARLEVKNAPQSRSINIPPIEIHYPNGVRLCIEEGLKDISFLAELVTLLPVAPCSR